MIATERCNFYSRVARTFYQAVILNGKTAKASVSEGSAEVTVHELRRTLKTFLRPPRDPSLHTEPTRGSSLKMAVS